jgi:hypothetical protein
MPKIRVTFDSKEYFVFKDIKFSWVLDQNFIFKRVMLNPVPTNKPFVDFITTINGKNRLSVEVFIDEKKLVSSFITTENINYKDTNRGGIEISIFVRDRFFPIKISDLISTINKINKFDNPPSVKILIQFILKELEFASSEFRNTYSKIITNELDFIVEGLGVDLNALKVLSTGNVTHVKAIDYLSTILSINNLVMVSNGFDSLFFEKLNSYENVIFRIFRNNNSSNISSAEKTAGNIEGMPPSKIAVLNNNGEGVDIQSSGFFRYDGGSPNVYSIKTINTESTKQQIERAINFEFIGIRAKANSFVYTIPSVIFDKNGDFFRPNRRVRVADERYGLDQDMVILGASTTINSSTGSVTSLNLTSQASFELGQGKQKRYLMKNSKK